MQPSNALPVLKGPAATWRAFRAMVRKEFLILTRYPVQFVASFGQIFVIVAIFSLASLTFVGGDQGDGIGATASGVVIYGFMLFLFVSDTLWTVGYNLRNEQKQGTLEQLYLTPASKFASLVARVSHVLLWTGLLSLAGVGMMAAILGRLPFHHPGLGLYLLVMSLTGTFGLGFAFAGLTLRVKETAQTLANGLQFLLLVVSANFFPFSALPAPLQAMARVNPLAYAVDAFRSTLMGYPPGFPELAPIEVEIVLVTLFGLTAPAVGYWLYKRAEQAARRAGSLAEY